MNTNIRLPCFLARSTLCRIGLLSILLGLVAALAAGCGAPEGSNDGSAIGSDAASAADAASATDAASAGDSASDSDGATSPDLGCAAPKISCDGVCTDLTADDFNCGACGKVCDDGSACTDGTCTLACAPGLTACGDAMDGDGGAPGGICADLQNDVANCGMCGAACPMGQVCNNAACVVSCGKPLVACNNVCIDPNTDPLNCGGCGTVCQMGQVCLGGACGCPKGFTACGNACYDTMDDPKHCGGCNPCAMGQVCAGGVCAAACAMPLVLCGMDCVDERVDPQNCGGCGTVCALAHATAACSKSACTVATCNAGYSDCDAKPSNGCETNTALDTGNCGGCKLACAPKPPNASPACSNGTCVAVCAPGHADCDANYANGCEIDTNTDVKNCGKCATACAVGQSCTMGVCGKPRVCSDGLKCLANCGQGDTVCTQDCYKVASLGPAPGGQAMTTLFLNNLIPHCGAICTPGNAKFNYVSCMACGKASAGPLFTIAISKCKVL